MRLNSKIKTRQQLLKQKQFNKGTLVIMKQNYIILKISLEYSKWWSSQEFLRKSKDNMPSNQGLNILKKIMLSNFKKLLK